MTQPDKDAPLDLTLAAHIRIPRELLIAALLEALRQQPELLATAIATIHPPESPLANRSPPWPDDAEAFGSLLRKRRAEATLTREQLSRRSGVAASTIRNIECCWHRPTMTTRSLLIQALEGPRVSEKEAGRISTFVEPPLQLIRSG